MTTESKKTLSNPESILLSGIDKKERIQMSNSNNNRINVPQAKEAMNQFKMQAAQESRRQPAERLQRSPDLP